MGPYLSIYIVSNTLFGSYLQPDLCPISCLMDFNFIVNVFLFRWRRRPVILAQANEDSHWDCPGVKILAY